MPAVNFLALSLFVVSAVLGTDVHIPDESSSFGCSSDEAALAGILKDDSQYESSASNLIQVLSASKPKQTSESEALLAAEFGASLPHLQFVHIPCTFGHTIEESGLGGLGKNSTAQIWLSCKASEAGKDKEAWQLMEKVKAPGGDLWGMMHPSERGISAATGCNLYYTPRKYWPAELQQKVFSDKAMFTILRDPYDRMANEFRLQVQGVDSGFSGLIRPIISEREGKMEREGSEYKSWYENCDVNSYLQAELGKYLKGDQYRGNCHLIPQAEYFDIPLGEVILVDNRRIPDSFNELVDKYGYSERFHMNSTIHNWLCNDVSAYSLTQETKDLIKQVYAADFALVCKHFGYCNPDELTCLEQIDGMCGSKPKSL